jgi:5-methyltetrahydropteroyltriglutamate--homocysteine methyltransferase
VLPAERIWVDPDCGLKTRTVEESRGKLAVMMTAVREVRATLR